MTKNLPAIIPAKSISLVPGKTTPVSWAPPSRMDFDEWLKIGIFFAACDRAVQWWLGDWWAYGEHTYGERAKAAADNVFGKAFKTMANYGWIARAVKTSRRREVLSFTHHEFIAPLDPDQQKKWLAKAIKEGWSANKLKAELAQKKAVSRTRQVAFNAGKLGRYVLLLADPPWRYENPPMGGSNRSIENHYPTMTLDEICALEVEAIAHENSILFLWATAPKLAECMQVITAWGFTYRTNAVWDKEKIGMGYHFRNQHELLLVAKRGELAPPAPDARPASIFKGERTEHSEKPEISYQLLDQMYPDLIGRKKRVELFARTARPDWATWGNQAPISEAAE